MVRIRHKTTRHELEVPEANLKAYPAYEPIKSEAPAEEKPTRSRKAEVTDESASD